MTTDVDSQEANLHRQLEEATTMAIKHKQQMEQLQRLQETVGDLRKKLASAEVECSMLRPCKAKLIEATTQNAHMVAAYAEKSQKLKRLEVRPDLGHFMRAHASMLGRLYAPDLH